MIAWLVETLAATTMLMLLVLALRITVRRVAGPQIAYTLWAIPALRMVLPPIPPEWKGDALPAVVDIAVRLGTPFATMAPTAPGSPGVAWLLLACWAAGAILFLFWHVADHRRFCASILASARRHYPVAGGRVEVIESTAAAGPMAFGVWRRRVAFPEDFADRYDREERKLVLAHELGHHARGDLLANWIALGILALHWFNPVAWRAFRAFRADQEMACDALVLADRSRPIRLAYGRAIVKSAHGGAISAACHLHGIHEIKGRLKMLTKYRRAGRGRIVAGGAGIAALALATLALTASGTQASERFRERVEGTIGINLDAIRLPAPMLSPAVQDGPAAPAAPIVPQPPVAPTLAPTIGTTPPAFVLDQSAEELEALSRKGLAFDTRDCGPGNTFTVTEPGPDGKDRFVVCTDRVEAQAAAAAEDSVRVEAMAETARVQALAAARSSIAAARITIENERNLTAEQRAEALAGLDEALREIEAETGG